MAAASGRTLLARELSTFTFFGDTAEEQAHLKVIDAFHAANSEIAIKPVHTPDSNVYSISLSSSLSGATRRMSY